MFWAETTRDDPHCCWQQPAGPTSKHKHRVPPSSLSIGKRFAPGRVWKRMENRMAPATGPNHAEKSNGAYAYFKRVGEMTPQPTLMRFNMYMMHITINQNSANLPLRWSTQRQVATIPPPLKRTLCNPAVDGVAPSSHFCPLC